MRTVALGSARVGGSLADFGVVHQPTDNPYLDGEVICEADGVCVVPRRHPFAQRKSVSARELLKERLICYREDTAIGGLVRRALRAAGERREVLAQKRRLDGAIVVPLVPLPQVAVAEAIGACLVGKQGDHAILRAAFGTGLLGHRGGPFVSVAWRRLRPASVIRYFCSLLLGLSGKVYSRFWSASSVRMILLSWPETPF